MDAILQADLQAVSDKDQVAFSDTIAMPPVPVPPAETVDFVPTPPAA
jgi:hypothetical protein